MQGSGAPTLIPVVGAAIIRHGRVLAARRVAPADVAGGWELPGGKVERGESAQEAVVREIREELGCQIEVTAFLAGTAAIKPGYSLSVALASLTSGEPIPHEHDAVRWLGPEDFDDVRWLEADRPFLPVLRDLLLDGDSLGGGHVGGAVRIGRTVRRPVGPWTPAVHAVLDHLGGRLSGVPRRYAFDERGREVLTFLPGNLARERLDDAQLVSVVRWTRDLHDAMEGFWHEGPWRFSAVDKPTVIGHNDLAAYNICFEADRVTGVLGWDLAGPSTPLLELASIAWNDVPLWREVDPGEAARRLELIASTYGGPSASEILHAVPGRVQLMLDGEPGRTAKTLADLARQLPLIEMRMANPDRPSPGAQ